MIWVMLILSLLICFMGIFSLGFCITLIKNGECITGKICEIDDGGSGGGTGGTGHHIIVEFIKDGQAIRLHTLSHFFLAPFFEKSKLSKLRKKHVGKLVHVYYNPARKTQALVREYIWKDFLCGLLLLFVGCFSILLIIMRWY